MKIKSKSGLIYRLNFKWNSVEITCSTAEGICSIFATSNIILTLEPLKLKVKGVGYKSDHESITYKCPFWKRRAVVKRLYNS